MGPWSGSAARGGSDIDWPSLLLLTLAGTAVVAPLLAFASAVRPTRATRWATRLCAAMMVAAVVLVVLLVWDAGNVERNEYGEGGDDSGVRLFMGAGVVTVGLWNFVGWSVASARARRGSRGPAGSTSR
ncbi:hypothetical protein [Egicoccus sp. AB-alg6-2]|uniref:hypothetical protein n=1 Tax=Egicoccus sp. AB-alg6-2 TaxID=3242692 RepID=UPI00359EE1F1